MHNISSVRIFAFIVVLLMLGLGVIAAVILPGSFVLSPTSHETKIEIEKFKSESEFHSYLQQASQKVAAGGGIARNTTLELAPTADFGIGGEDSSSRVSETNVQVRGIDEPDIVKTNGNQIFYSNPEQFRILEEAFSPDLPSDVIVPPVPSREIKIINAFPVDNLELQSAVNQGGELLLNGNTLIVIDYQKLTAFDVSDPTNPQKTWEYELQDAYLETSRMMNGELILITRNYVASDSPCVIPLMSNGIKIACTEIYRPSIPTPSDSIYTAIKINPEFGDVKSKVSFTGSTSSSVVYVSPNSIYVTYSYSNDPVSLFIEFYNSQSDLLPTEYQERLSKLGTYEISDQAKLVEYQQIISDYEATLSSDDRLKFEQEVNDKMKDYAQSKVRDVEKTGIVKIALNNFDATSNGTVPGSPLNQFSIDEYAGNLRIATTVGQNSWLFPAESVNDLYILNDNLETIGSVQNLAQGERIYSARFINDVAYLVTFKQIDPFFVVDLSSPSNPKVTGELKIPGFSSYLHPLSENIILGVGQEENQVKLSLFDVADPANPTETDKYLLDEYWTEVQNNHHAFLQDDKHSVFFIPGGRGGYIFSYADNKLSLAKAVSETGTQRAIFIDDYMYIIGSENITVLDETDWGTVSTLSL